MVRDRVETPADAFELLARLEERAELFAALVDAGHEYWVDLPAAKALVRDLNLFRSRQMTPVFFAAWKRFSDEDFVWLLKLVRDLAFRYSIVSRLNPNPLEPASHAAAKAVIEGRATRPRAVFEQLGAIYVDDDRFERDFARWTIGKGRRDKLAKYVLVRLEGDVSGRASDPDADPATVEHVLPENPSGDWAASFPPDKWDAAVDRLGNLTLLERAANREVGSGAYALKRAAYEASGYALSRQIAELAPEEWTLPLLEERQRRLAERAVRIWRVDFAASADGRSVCRVR